MQEYPCHYWLVQKDPHLLLTSELRLPRFIILCIVMTSRSEYELHPRISTSNLIGKYNAEAATSGVPWKKVFLEISQNSKENTCATVSFLIKLQACNFIKKDTLAQVFSCEFCEISQNTFFTEHLWTTASEYNGWSILWRPVIRAGIGKWKFVCELKKAQFKIRNRGRHIFLFEKIIGKYQNSKDIVYQMCTYYWYSQRNCNES